MYFSKIQIENFRCFDNIDIDFNDGLNVIIGHNNSGKSNLIKALSLLLNYQGAKRLEVDDFNKNISIDKLKESPPKISIALTITQSEDEDLNSDDLVTVGNWLTKLETPYEALLTYEFFLPEKETERYIEALKSVTKLKDVWKFIKHDFIRLYTYKIYGGSLDLRNVADGESLQKFDFQFLDAIRDVERDMFTGRNTLLRDVLDFFMDYEIKNNDEKADSVKESEIKIKKKEFSKQADDLLGILQDRMQNGKKQILSYAEKTGASFNKATPDFEGSISDVEMFSALKLIVKYETGIEIPVTHNGLGYNNLIFMSLLLAKMQVNSDGKYLGSNAKVFPVLVIEEPEAHLHPSMQYKFLKFLKENMQENKKVRQIFVTTHSTQITAAVLLDDIICLHNEEGKFTVGYPGKVFPDDELGKKAKAYVQRFLDATRSDMLFAQKLILVEGITEQLVLSIMAEYLGKSLEDHHVGVINVGGRYFDYFLYLFDNSNRYAIPKKVACLTDRDPVRKERKKKEGEDEQREYFEQCYPFEYNLERDKYEYKSNIDEKIDHYKTHQNIHFFSQNHDQGKSFEYELVICNPSLDLLVADSIKNAKEIRDLMDLYRNGRPISEYFDKLRKSKKNQRIIGALNDSSWGTEDDRKKAIIASRYYNSIQKGENALELACVLQENLKKDSPAPFNVPDYIKEGVEWLCQQK